MGKTGPGTAGENLRARKNAGRKTETMRDLDYLKLLAKEYPTVKAASSEIINLMAIRGLPKGTEYFFSDLHGEYEAFIHLLRSASGIIREKISETFGYVISDEEEIALANLIYYPERNIRRIQKEGKFTEDWQRITIYRLVRICKEVSSKFTRSKVRKKMPPAFAYIIDELLHVDYNDDNKKVYYDEIIHSIIDIEMGDQFIMALCNLIQNLTVDSLHIIGDIFDRGPRADIIMDELMHFHDVDIQWGNHDISWMGAATGNLACICNVLRIAIRYNGFDVLEDGYGTCTEYSYVYAAMLNYIGFDAKTVDGKTAMAAGGYGYHMWVEVTINGQVYVMDPQVDDNMSWGAYISHDRFCKTYSEVKNKYIKD